MLQYHYEKLITKSMIEWPSDFDWSDLNPLQYRPDSPLSFGSLPSFSPDCDPQIVDALTMVFDDVCEYISVHALFGVRIEFIVRGDYPGFAVFSGTV